LQGLQLNISDLVRKTAIPFPAVPIGAGHLPSLEQCLAAYWMNSRTRRRAARAARGGTLESMLCPAARRRVPPEPLSAPADF